MLSNSSSKVPYRYRRFLIRKASYQQVRKVFQFQPSASTFGTAITKLRLPIEFPFQYGKYTE